MGRLNVPGRVSVVLAIYNGEKYLRDAIRSILNQTYSDIELIVVDDGSTDESMDIVKAYMVDSTIPIVLYNTNGPNHFTPMG